MRLAAFVGKRATERPSGGIWRQERTGFWSNFRSELLHVAWLAHLGFKHMMPNYRSFDVHRFDGRVDAQDGSFAVENSKWLFQQNIVRLKIRLSNPKIA